MKKLLLLSILLIACFKNMYCQDELIVKSRINSILQQVEKETNKDARDSLILTIFSTQIDGFPYLGLYTYEKLNSVSERNKDAVIKAFALSFAGHSYRLLGNYVKGLEYHNKAVAAAEKTGNPIVLALAKILMAHLYKDREEYKKATQLYLAANKINPSIPNSTKIIIWSRGNLSRVYLDNNQLDSCLYYALNIKPYKDTSFYMTRSYTEVASAYSKMGNMAEATKYFYRAISIVENSMLTKQTQLLYLSFAEHFRRINQMDSSILYARKALAIVDNTAFSYLSLAPAKFLMDIYQQSDADSTLKYLKIYTAANDSLYSKRANQQLQMMTFEEDQRQQNALTEKTAYQNKVRATFLWAGLLLFSLIAIFLYRNNLQKQKANKALEKSLADLKSTQSQLIQSEKMASLGELTVGIAHEIQNPLNFVNNFSEVNQELIGELVEEVNKGNTDEVKAIANDIKENSEKINHHGKRAGDIVKGMLQHSRSSSGVKELTDINALCDEYLRLSYHGLRAKDKSFNATMKTDFDNTIGNINIIPQDIGRVVLNLLTNSFYVVNEKKQHQSDGYDPTVSISTKKIGDKVEIKVTDNGNGIPQKVIDKIFQPFFTTKPTGQGTGLGLSLSYDIIKAHGGELKVETKEGEGSTFIISLLTNTN